MSGIEAEALDVPADELPGLGAAGETVWPVTPWSLPLRAALVTAADETVTHLHLREPTVAEFEQIIAWPLATRRRYSVSLITGLPMGDVARVAVGDVVRAEAYLTSFFDIGQVIGV